jgi:hypothetical protein
LDWLLPTSIKVESTLDSQKNIKNAFIITPRKFEWEEKTWSWEEEIRNLNSSYIN